VAPLQLSSSQGLTFSQRVLAAQEQEPVPSAWTRGPSAYSPAAIAHRQGLRWLRGVAVPSSSAEETEDKEDIVAPADHKAEDSDDGDDLEPVAEEREDDENSLSDSMLLDYQDEHSVALLQNRAGEFMYNQNNEQEVFLAAQPFSQLSINQRDAVDFMLRREASPLRYETTTGVVLVGGGILALDTRMGKTLAVLTLVLRALQQRIRREPSKRFGRPTLMVVPKNVQRTIKSEYNKHFGSDETGPLLVRCIGRARHARKLTGLSLCASADIVLTTYPTIATLWRQQGTASVFYTQEWERVIADEAHLFTNGEKQLYRAMMGLRARTARWFVSATPIQNTRAEMTTVVRFVGVPTDAIPPQGTADWKALLNTLLMIRKRDTRGGGLPIVAAQAPAPVIDRVVHIPFREHAESALYAHYHALMKRDVRQEERLTNRTLKMILRLRQLCAQPFIIGELSGPDHTAIIRWPPAPALVATDWAQTDYSEIGTHLLAYLRHALLGETSTLTWRPDLLPPMSPKERWLMDHYRLNVEPHAGHKMVVWFTSVKWLEMVRDLFSARALLLGQPVTTSPVVVIVGGMDEQNRAACLHRMAHDPTARVLLITFKTGGTGEDFSFASDAVIPEPWWNPQVVKQSLDRLIGSNQKRQVRCYRLVMMGDTIEAIVQQIAADKAEELEQLYRQGRGDIDADADGKLITEALFQYLRDN